MSADSRKDVSDSEQGDCSSPPKDIKQIARCLFFLQGISTLVPWNTYVTANAFYSARLAGTSHEGHFENTFSLATMGCNTIGFVLALYASRRQSFNIRASVAVPLIVISSTLALSTGLVLQEDLDPEVFFQISLASVVVCAVSTAFLQMGIFGIAARFPPQITHGVLVGQGSAGIVISLLSLLTTLRETSRSDVTAAAFLYFFSATSIVSVTLLALCFMSRLEFAVYYAFGESWLNSLQSGCVTPKQNSPLGSPRVGTFSGRTNPLQASLLRATSSSPGTPQSDCSTRASTPVIDRRPSLLSYKRDILESPVISEISSPSIAEKPSIADPFGVEEDGETQLSIFHIIKCISGSIATVVMTLLVTLSIFPALLAQIRPASNPRGVAFPETGRLFGDAWVPFLFLTFNVFDTAGRAFSNALSHRPGFTRLLALARFALIPILLFMSSPPTGELPIVWARAHDATCVALVGLVGITSGMVLGSAMIHGPSCVPQDFKSRAGTIMSFSLQMGLLLGSASSCVIDAWVNPITPVELRP